MKKILRRFKKTRLQYGQSALVQSSFTLVIIGVILILAALVTSAAPALVLGLMYLVGGTVGLVVGYMRTPKEAVASESGPVEYDGYWHRFSRK